MCVLISRPGCMAGAAAAAGWSRLPANLPLLPPLRHTMAKLGSLLRRLLRLLRRVLLPQLDRLLPRRCLLLRRLLICRLPRSLSSSGLGRPRRRRRRQLSPAGHQLRVNRRLRCRYRCRSGLLTQARSLCRLPLHRCRPGQLGCLLLRAELRGGLAPPRRHQHGLDVRAQAGCGTSRRRHRQGRQAGRLPLIRRLPHRSTPSAASWVASGAAMPAP